MALYLFLPSRHGQGQMYLTLCLQFNRVMHDLWLPPQGRSVPSARVLDMQAIGRPETSVRNYHYLLHNNPEEHSSLTRANLGTYILVHLK